MAATIRINSTMHSVMMEVREGPLTLNSATQAPQTTRKQGMMMASRTERIAIPAMYSLPIAFPPKLMSKLDNTHSGEVKTPIIIRNRAHTAAMAHPIPMLPAINPANAAMARPSIEKKELLIPLAARLAVSRTV